jgi:hypothetical protein
MIVKIVVPSPTGTPRASKFLMPVLGSMIHTCTTASIVDSMVGDDAVICVVVDKVVAVAGVDGLIVDIATEVLGVDVVADVITGADVATDETSPLVFEVMVIVVTIFAHNDPSVRIFWGESIPSSTGPKYLSSKVPFSE